MIEPDKKDNKTMNARIAIISALIMKKTQIPMACALLAITFFSGCGDKPEPSTPQSEVTAAEAKAIAKEASIYGFPMVDNYRVQHAYFVDRDNPEFKANWNQIRNEPRVYTHEDVAIQT